MNIDDLLRPPSPKAPPTFIEGRRLSHDACERRLVPLDEAKRLDNNDTLAMGAAVMSPAQREKYKETQEIDLAYSVAGLGRFRCNIFQQRGTMALVLRVIPTRILTWTICCFRPCCATSARKSAAWSGDRHHRQRQEHHAGGDDRPHQQLALLARDDGGRPDRVPSPRQPDRSSISAKWRWTPSRSRTALRSALRQDPDVILVGEMRDFETIETGLLAAETGHLVFSRSTRWTPPRPSTASSPCFRPISRNRSGCSWRRCSRPSYPSA
jgi:twitching motility protein PilT